MSCPILITRNLHRFVLKTDCHKRPVTLNTKQECAKICLAQYLTRNLHIVLKIDCHKKPRIQCIKFVSYWNPTCSGILQWKVFNNLIY